MSNRVGGFIGQDGLNAPDEPTNVAGTAGDQQVEVSFTAPSDVGGSAITGYRAQSNDGIGASGSASPITVTGLTNDTAYTFRVWALNAFGYSAPSDASGSVTPALKIAIFNGYDTDRDLVEKINFSTQGNSVSFGGNLSANKYGNAWWGSATRAVTAGGFLPYPTSAAINVVEYLTFASAGNATAFGDLSAVRQYAGALSNSTRGIVGAGAGSPFGPINIIEYFTTASTGNATNFGDLTFSRYYASGVSSPTRGLFMGGDN
jgi:hypothetical protein